MAESIYIYVVDDPTVRVGEPDDIIVVSAVERGPAGQAFSAGASSLGNTLGTTGIVGGQLLLVGGSNVTLSESINGPSGTVTIIGGGGGGSVLSLVGGNNVTLSESIDGSTRTVTIQGADPGLLAVADANGNSLSSGTLHFVSTNGISFDMTGDSIGAYYDPLYLFVRDGNTAGETGYATLQLDLVGGDNITLSASFDEAQRQGTVTIIGPDVPTGFLTNAIQTLFVGSDGAEVTQAHVELLDYIAGPSGVVWMVGDTNLPQGAISASVDAMKAGISNIGNTAGTSGTNRQQVVFAGGNNVTLSQSTNTAGATITVSAVSQSTHSHSTAPAALAAGTQTATSGTVLLADSNGLAFGMSGSTRITGSYTQSTHSHNPAFSAGVSNLGNTSGTSGVQTNQVVLAGGNNVTLSQSTNTAGATITISAANETQTVPPIATAVKQDVSTVASTGTITRFAPEDHQHRGVNSAGISNIGNTAGTSGANPGRVVFAGGNNITLSQSTDATGSTISISGANAGGAQTGISGIIAGTQTATSGTVSFADSNGLAFGMSGSTRITGSYTQSTHAHSDLSAGMTNVGNTSGDRFLLGNGQVVFAGGNNVTLSGSTNGSSATLTISAANETQTVPPIATAVKQDVSTVASTGTITRFAPEDHMHRGVNSAGISNIGNTSGTSGAGPGRLVLAGGNQVTLSQSTDATGSTVTISAAETQTVPPIATAVKQDVSTVASTGTITRFAPEDHQHRGVNSAGISNIGNTVGTSGVGPGRVVFAGGNNITLSQSTDATGSTISVSAPNLGAGGAFSGGISNIGNTSGSSGVTGTRYVLAGGNNITLSQSTDANGGTLTISAFNESPDIDAVGISNLGNTSGTSGTGAGTLVLVGGTNVTLSQSTAASARTISILGSSAPTLNMYDNGVANGVAAMVVTAPPVAGSLLIFPLHPAQPLFGGNMTVQTMFLDMSFSSSIGVARTFTFQLGLYTVNGTSTLSLLNSASSTTTFASNAATSLYSGIRFLSFLSSQFSTDFTLSHNGSYYMAFNILTAGASGGMSYVGMGLGGSFSRLGTFGSGQSASNTGQGFVPFAGVLSVTTNAMPASIHASAISQARTAVTQPAGYVPHINLQALISSF